MTGNPVVHMGMPSIVVFLIIGIAWGMMPVNPYKFRHGKWGRILVAVAGPAMNLVLAIVSLTVLGFILNPWEGSPAPIETFLLMGGFLNLVLFALNMLPVPPLDGSMILANLSTTVARWYTHPQAQMAGLLLFLALIWSNMFGVVFEFARETAMNYAILVFNLVH
jgi:Zn-dependent protease